MMRRRRPLMRQEGGTTQGSRFNAPMIGNVSEAGRSSLSGMSIQDLLARLEAPTVPSRYAEGGRTYSDNDLVMIEELSPQDEMQAEYDAEIAGLGSGTGLGGFFQDLLYGGMDPEELSELDFTPEFMQDLPEVPEEVEIAMSIVGPGKGKGISSLIGKAGELKGLGKKLVDSTPSPRESEMKIMRDMLKKGSTRKRPEGGYTVENLRRAYSKPRIDPDRMAAGGRPGLYANIHAKRKRIAAGSGERMRKPGSKGAPTAANFKQAAKTAKRAGGGHLMNTGYYGKSYR
jgi:hypothetical protein